jgi:hypothetical protein
MAIQENAGAVEEMFSKSKTLTSPGTCPEKCVVCRLRCGDVRDDSDGAFKQMTGDRRQNPTSGRATLSFISGRALPTVLHA